LEKAWVFSMSLEILVVASSLGHKLGVRLSKTVTGKSSYRTLLINAKSRILKQLG
jgi:hypothetical protein